MHKKTLNELKSSDKSIGKIIELSTLFLTNQGIENAKNEIAEPPFTPRREPTMSLLSLWSPPQTPKCPPLRK